MRSWNGSVDLKRRVLAQMDAHRAADELGPLRFGDEEVEVYDWPRPADTRRLSELISVPEQILCVGALLCDGFPEDDDGVREVVEETRELLNAIPVGADTSNVTTELVFWRLTDERWGIRGTIEDASMRALLDECAMGLISGNPTDAVRARVARALEVETNEVARRAHAERSKVEAAQQRVGVLWVLRAVCGLGDGTSTAEAVVRLSMKEPGHPTAGKETVERALRRRLLDLLAASGGW